MSLIPCTTKQALDPINEFFNTENLWAWGNFPAIDVAEDKDKFTIKADLPGLNKEDIKLSLEDGILSIEGERKQANKNTETQYYRLERAYGRFVRNINLGAYVDADSVSASYNNGVLEIVVTKSEKAKARSIAIN